MQNRQYHTFNHCSNVEFNHCWQTQSIWKQHVAMHRLEAELVKLRQIIFSIYGGESMSGNDDDEVAADLTPDEVLELPELEAGGATFSLR